MSTRDDSRLTHPLNVGYLVVGLVCLGIAGLWALHAADVVDTAQVGWLLPLTLVVAGAIGLVALAVRGLTRHSGSDDTYDSYEQPYGDAYDEQVTDLAALEVSAFGHPVGDEPQDTAVLPRSEADPADEAPFTNDQADDQADHQAGRLDDHQQGEHR